jgi:ubiquinone biosynthesis protein UbiJ
MLHSLNTLLAPALMERVVLVVNHVLGAEPVAMQRLQPHSGRIVGVQLQDWPTLLPMPPELSFRITPAGLLEWCGRTELPAAADLGVRVDASNPVLLTARALTGEPPAVHIDGDAQLAAEVNWLLQNLRWDVGADLQRLVGPAIAQPLQQLGSALARALRGALQRAPGLAPRDPAPPP